MISCYSHMILSNNIIIQVETSYNMNNIIFIHKQ